MSKHPAIAVIAPTRARARRAADFLARRTGAAAPFSLAGYLACRRAPRRLILCPAGRSVADDIAFLRKVRDRVLWDAPEEVIYSAIAGFLGSLPEAPNPLPRRRQSRPSRKGEGAPKAALLLEGTVDSARARALLGEDARFWIVEHPRKVRVGAVLMEQLRRKGVRWCALRPLSVAGILASPGLARASSRWKRDVAPGAPIWVVTSPPGRPLARTESTPVSRLTG